MDRFILRYVPLGAPLSEPELRVFVRRLEKELGTSPDITVQVVTELPLSAQGKTRLIVGLESKPADGTATRPGERA